MPKNYTVWRNAGNVRVMVEDRYGARWLTPERSQRFLMISKDFDFGRDSKGSEQLAHAILLEELHDPRRVEALCRQFTEGCVAKWSGDMVTVTENEILKWVSEAKEPMLVT